MIFNLTREEVIEFLYDYLEDNLGYCFDVDDDGYSFIVDIHED